MKSISILLLLTATLTAANPALPVHDLRTYLHRRHHNSGPILLRRAKPVKAAVPGSQFPVAQADPVQRPNPSANPSKKAGKPGSGIRDFGRGMQFDKQTSFALTAGAAAAGGALIGAASLVGGGPAVALTAAGMGMHSVGMAGMALHHAWDQGREATRDARRKKQV